MTEHNNPQDNVTVPRELLRQALKFVYDLESPTALSDALRAALDAPAVEPDAIGCRCSVCGEWQRWTPSGMVCKNGHGGVPGVNHRLFTAPKAQQPAVQEPDVDYRSMYLKVRDELAEAQQRLDTCEALARSVMTDQVGRA